MLLNHNKYLNYQLPTNWCAEYVDELLLLYDPNGFGVMTLSFFNKIESEKSIDEQISICAKKFINKNNITLFKPLIITGSEETKIILQGTGNTLKNDFIKIWVVAKSSKIIFITYESEEKSDELQKCESVIESMSFNFVE